MGIASGDDARRRLRAGSDKLSITTAAVENPDVHAACSDAFGAQAVVVAIDAKARAGGGWEVFTYGGRRATGLDVVDYAQLAVSRGAGEILLTSMDRDGARIGYDTALTRAVSSSVSVPVIASGGAGSTEDLIAVAVLAASIFHFGEISIGEAKRAMAAAGLPVRLT